MSSIDRLLLQGIRSFGPDDRDKQGIKFSTPLTLILGQNGCGKTTIIEALKYATCGELPVGVDQGSGFLHDPKLCGCIDVKGHVKLKFKDVKGEENTIARTSSVTQKAKTLVFKTLDTTLTDAHGKSISTRCNDIDSWMSNALGVSKAVLTNVIFCHQEDSAWPLEKGKKMKDRFDAIFGITEYNKCLDYMRVLAKKYEGERALAKKDVDLDEEIWKETEKKKSKLESHKASLCASCDEVAKIENELAPLNSTYNEILEKEMNLGNHLGKIRAMKDKRDFLKENQRDLQKKIKNEFPGTTQELQAKLQNFEQDLRNEKAKLETLQGDRDLVIREEERHQKNIGAKQTTLGTLQNEKDQNDQRVGNRNLYMNKLADELKLTVVSSCDMNQDRASQLLESIEQKLKEENRTLDKMQEEGELEEEKLQHEIYLVREKKTSMEHEIRVKRKNIQDNKDETIKIKKRIEDVDKSAQTLAALEKELAKIDKDLEEVTKSLDVNEHNTRVSENTSKRNRLESKLTELSEEIKTLQKFSILKANLDQLLDRKRKQETTFNELKEKNSNSLKHLLNEVPQNNFKKTVQAHLDKLSSDVKTKEKLISDKETQLVILKEKKRNLDNQLLLKKRKLADDEDRIADFCGDNDFETFLKRAEEKLCSAQDSKGTSSASQFMYKRYLDKLNSENPICPTCRRDFSNEDEIRLVVTDLNKRLKTLPDQIAQAEKEVKEAIEQQNRAVQLQSVYENISQIKKDELPKLKKEVNDIKVKIDELESELQTLRDELTAPSTDQAIATGLLSDCTTLDHLYQELRKLQQDIETQEQKIPVSKTNKTMQQAQDEEDDFKAQLNVCRMELENSQSALSKYHEKLNKLRERRNEIITKQMTTKGNVQQRKELSDKLDDLQMTTVLYESELSNMEKELNPTSEKLIKLTQDLNKMKMDHKMKIVEKKKKLVEFDKRVHEITTLHQAIEEYNNKGGTTKLDKTRQELAELQLTKNENSRERDRIDKEIQSIKQTLQAEELKKMDYENNLQFRKKQEEISKLENEIVELEGQAGEITLQSLNRQKTKLKQEIDQLEKKKSSVEGRQFELKKTIKEAEYELKDLKYQNAEQNYRKSVVNLKVLGLAIDDLRQYEKAMDWAMIYFHKERMKTINTMVRDLWRQIYRGNDIDQIEIKTDEASPTPGGRRSYNYRVVQIKGGHELDMPGRCSAGQKVLACLIIRMALAETFSKNCGILTLDEPTTNLDRENIESLSIALSDIVSKRMCQKNFQLIIITHDEEFLRNLTRVDRIDHYLKVYRNDRGKSEVRKIKL
ncbi:DNA repair protein RAD50 [Planococcus citri]|uniref:DNA repair protein RAD50 n=1 Tax=Planococcus citri TaxID=170843 RepID=UPI0031F8EA6E